MSSTDDTLNQRLQQLVHEASQHPVKTPQRQIALNKLVKEIQSSGKLGHPQRGLWPTYVYEDLYNEALGKMFIEICQNLERYNPQYPVMAWVNFILEKRFIDVIRRYQNYQKRNRSLEDLKKDLPATEEDSQSQQVREFIQNDPENLLKNESIRGRADVTFQKILWLKDVEAKKWKEISETLNVSIPTLSSFYERRLHKLNAYFRKYLQE